MGVIRFRADVLSIYQLASTLKRYYVVTGRENQFHDFILSFLVQVGQAMESPTYDNPTPHFIYGTARSSSADSRTSLEQRTNVILAKFLEFAPDLQTKDPTRTFNYWQKLAIYYKDKGYVNFAKLPLHSTKERLTTSFDMQMAGQQQWQMDDGSASVVIGRFHKFQQVFEKMQA